MQLVADLHVGIGRHEAQLHRIAAGAAEGGAALLRAQRSAPGSPPPCRSAA
jgi:hypothetical protein